MWFVYNSGNPPELGGSSNCNKGPTTLTTISYRFLYQNLQFEICNCGKYVIANPVDFSTGILAINDEIQKSYQKLISIKTLS